MQIDVLHVRELKHRVTSFEGIRGLAVLAVLASHLPWRGEVILPSGYVSVTMFLVMSGFLITLVLTQADGFGSRRWYRTFLRKRFWRLTPVLAIFLSLSLLSLLAFAGSARGIVRDSGTGALLAMTYSVNVANVVGVESGVFAHLWTLSLEEQFYLFWPLGLILLTRTGMAIRKMCALLVLALIILAAIRAAVVLGVGLNAYSFQPDMLLMGCLAALAYRHKRDLPRLVDAVPARLLLWTLGVLSALGALLGGRESPLMGVVGYPLMGLFFALLLLRFSFGMAPRIMLWRPFVALGRASYSLYLWHMPVVMISGLHLSSDLAVAAVSIPLSLAVGFASFHMIEQPFLRKSARIAFTPAAVMKPRISSAPMRPPGENAVRLARVSAPDAPYPSAPAA